MPAGPPDCPVRRSRRRRTARTAVPDRGRRTAAAAAGRCSSRSPRPAGACSRTSPRGPFDACAAGRHRRTRTCTGYGRRRGRAGSWDQAVRVATTSAKASSAVADRALGEHLEQRLGLGGQADDVGAGLGHRRVGAQQGERLGVQGVVGRGRRRAARAAGRRPGRSSAARSAPAASGRPRAGRCRASCRTPRSPRPMSRMSSESWKATPTFSPYSVSASSTSARRAGEHARRSGRRSRSASRSCRRPRAGSARAGPRRRPGPSVSRIWPSTSRVKVCAWIRTASAPSSAVSSEDLENRKSPVRIATWLSQRALADSAPRRRSASSITSSW